MSRLRSLTQTLHKSVWIVCLSVGLSSAGLFAQNNAQNTSQPTATDGALVKLPEFEVASIREVSPSGPGAVETIILPQGKVILRKKTVLGLICIAFNVGFWEVEGADPHLKGTYYNIEVEAPQTSDAKPFDTKESNGFIEDANLRQMLQALLISRFQLKFRREPRTSSVEVLEKNGGTFRLVTATATSDSSDAKPHPLITARTGSGWVLRGVSMPELARYLSLIVRKPVLDYTNLRGVYDFTSKEVLSEEELHSGTLDSLLPALKEMGLKLRGATGASEKLIIDHIESPSPN